MKIGRNAPCPCGSGRKYKACCLKQASPEPVSPFPWQDQSHDESASIEFDNREGLGSDGAIPKELRREIQSLLDENPAVSLEHLQSRASNTVQAHNERGLSDFEGLSPEQMRVLLYGINSDSPAFVQFHTPTDVSGAPVMRLAELLFDAVGEDGLKQTAKGNLPRQACRDIAAEFVELDENNFLQYRRVINSELDFLPLNVLRIITVMAGLLRKYKKRYVLTKRARELLDKKGIEAFYPELLSSFTEKYNWGYGDGYPELHFVQHSWRYTLWLLHKFGATEQTADFYAAKYQRAFPMLEDEVMDEALHNPSALFHLDPEDNVARAYRLRTLERFSEFFGIVEMRRTRPKSPFSEYTLKSGPLFHQIVTFTDGSLHRTH